MTEFRAKNISIKAFDTIEQFDEWKEQNPLNLIKDIQITNKIYIIYIQVNYD